MFRALVVVCLSACCTSIKADEPVEQVEIFASIAWPWADKDGKTQLQKANERLRELQRENVVTRMTFSGNPQTTGTYVLTVFYKPGKAPHVEQVAIYDGLNSPNVEHREGKTGKEWINEQLKNLQKDNKLLAAQQAGSGKSGSETALLVIYTKK